ncbi:probable low molecular weight phosphotyrosine protein phosphatase [Coccomyxa sp. Obi]|nr:probable low molecular weight phosphotyrosine protein phosphatase [Coccomyxa sp. Obi]
MQTAIDHPSGCLIAAQSCSHAPGAKRSTTGRRAAHQAERYAAQYVPSEASSSIRLTRCRASAREETPSEQIDVSSIFVDTTFRSTPWAQEKVERESSRTAARILFVSESNVCRSVLAEVLTRQILQDRGLSEEVLCESKGTRDYNLGEGPEVVVTEVAAENDITLPEDFKARHFSPDEDIVQFDLVMVMDKFTAADVLREVSVFDTINTKGNYSKRVRRLGEFHPQLAKIMTPDGQDIDDPLYGNKGGATEKEAVEATLRTLREACEGLVDWLVRLREGLQEGESLRAAVSRAVRDMNELEWLVPPMLQTR